MLYDCRVQYVFWKFFVVLCVGPCDVLFIMCGVVCFVFCMPCAIWTVLRLFCVSGLCGGLLGVVRGVLSCVLCGLSRNVMCCVVGCLLRAVFENKVIGCSDVLCVVLCGVVRCFVACVVCCVFRCVCCVY